MSKKSASIIALVISLLYLITIITGNSMFLGTVWIILTILLALLMLAIGMAAAVIVVKSLFVVAAELSLLIFITQSYCSAPENLRFAENNSAMSSLFTVAILYIAFLFVQSLWLALKENYEKMKSEPGAWEKWITIATFLIFIGFFVLELYLIMNPIVSSLCVYK